MAWPYNVFMLQSPKPKRGFTLIELLVVISIISLLSSIVLTSLNSARGKARDAQRLASLRQLQNALELYYDKFFSYPATAATYAIDYVSGGNPNQNSFETDLQSLVTEGFISKVPHDPLYPAPAFVGFLYARNNAPSLSFSDASACGGLTGGANPNYQYVLIFWSEKTAFNLPAYPTNSTPPTRYCLIAR